MTTESNLERARAAFARKAWTEAAERYAAADRETPLALEDLERAGLARHLIDDDQAGVELRTRAYHAALRAGQVPRAARLAFWLGMSIMQRGDMAVAGGWLARAGRLAGESGVDCVERGYVLIPEGLRALDAGEPAAAMETFERASAVAVRFGDDELATLARLGRGQAAIDLGDVERGLRLLDEALVAVTSNEVGPIVAGIAYCASIEAFQAAFDLRRAQEWTDALTRWCATQPDLVPFRGRCLVFRAMLMRLHGSWPEATVEARRAEEWLMRPPPEPAVGEALYEQAELRRLRGAFSEAEATYREAARWGRRPEPGLALLRLAQGDATGAVAMLRRALGEASSDVARAPLLEPFVEAAIAAGEVAAATDSVVELTRIAERSRAPLLLAMATRAEATVRLAGGDAVGALTMLRRSAAAWQAVAVPYELARVRTSIGFVLRALGDAAGAEIELDAARRTFGELGAEPDLVRLAALTGGPVRRPGGLSAREMEVLHLLARGLTNRAIADALVISERTVDRHVSNIYAKLGVTSRSAATAFAYEHGVVES